MLCVATNKPCFQLIVIFFGVELRPYASIRRNSLGTLRDLGRDGRGVSCSWQQLERIVAVKVLPMHLADPTERANDGLCLASPSL